MLAHNGGLALNSRAFQYYRRLKKIKEFVEENYAEEIRLGKAAQIAAMERTYFSTFFRQKVGITFTDWLRQVRIAKAIEMITVSNHSITYIAYEVGFGDLRTFERAFKNYCGMTPSEFKNRISTFEDPEVSLQQDQLTRIA